MGGDGWIVTMPSPFPTNIIDKPALSEALPDLGLG